MARPAFLALVVGLLACTAGAEAARKPVRHTVTIDGARFSPADLTVADGETVVSPDDPHPDGPMTRARSRWTPVRTSH
jgi:hypothetical protein